MTVKVRATVNIAGLHAGEEVEIELNELIRSLLRAGLLLALVPTSG